jgi:hypothetical protein
MWSTERLSRGFPGMVSMGDTHGIPHTRIPKACMSNARVSPSVQSSKESGASHPKWRQLLLSLRDSSLYQKDGPLSVQSSFLPVCDTQREEIVSLSITANLGEAQ